jgi:hypothetical protein
MAKKSKQKKKKDSKKNASVDLLMHQKKPIEMKKRKKGVALAGAGGEVEDPEIQILGDQQSFDMDLARGYWTFGEWHKLTQIDLKRLERNKDREKLALVIAAAHQQLGQHADAMEFINLAIEYGCNHTTALEMMLASAHTTMARIHAIKNDTDRTVEHIRSSIIFGAPGVDVHMLLDCKLPEESARSRYGIISHDRYEFAGKAKLPGKKRKVIVVAGMRHSGSTALFNLLRLSLMQTGVKFISCYSEYKNCIDAIINTDAFGLIKTHEKREDVAQVADVILTTRRDLRDTVASAVRRKFPMYTKAGSTLNYAEYNRKLHDEWWNQSDYEFIYEYFMNDPFRTMDEVLDKVGIRGVDLVKLKQELDDLPTDKYEVTLLSDSHITDPKHEISYRDTLEADEIRDINERHYDWLSRYGYMPVDRPQIF